MGIEDKLIYELWLARVAIEALLGVQAEDAVGKLAGTVLRNGPANAKRTPMPIKCLEIHLLAVVRFPFSRTARRSVPAFARFLTASSACAW